MRIGYIRSSYTDERNFLYLRDYGVNWCNCPDQLDFIHKIWHRVSGRGYSAFLHSIAWPVNYQNLLVHGFHTIQIGKHPWIVTYSSNLPRKEGLPKFMVAWAWRKLAEDQCRAILALSKCAADRLRADLMKNRPGVPSAVIEAVEAKLSVLHPPQPILFDVSEKQSRGLYEDEIELRLVLVGHDFYRKGGLEVLIAMEALLKEGRNISLSIVGKMSSGDYASRAGSYEVGMAEEIIMRLGTRIQRRGTISSSAVYDLLKESHVLCLPTWGETYGYSVLEGQASACPAVTTDIRALPEINNEDCGWVISVPKLKGGDADLGTVEKRESFRRILVDGLIKALREAHDDRLLLRRKAAASVERIRNEHDPDIHSERLLAFYQNI